MSVLWMGIDNGSSGHYTVMDRCGSIIEHGKMPVKEDRGTMARKLNRLDHDKFKMLLRKHSPAGVVMERCAFIKVNAIASAEARAFMEACMLILEQEMLPFEVIPSSDWQKVMLPPGKRDKGETKKAAADVCYRMFPALKTKEPDSVLMVEWLRRRQGGNHAEEKEG